MLKKLSLLSALVASRRRGRRGGDDNGNGSDSDNGNDDQGNSVIAIEDKIATL